MRTELAIQSINSLLDGKNILRSHREFADNFPENKFSRNLPKIILVRFSVDFQIFQKLSENSLSISRKNNFHEFCQKHFPEFSSLSEFLRNFWDNFLS